MIALEWNQWSRILSSVLQAQTHNGLCAYRESKLRCNDTHVHKCLKYKPESKFDYFQQEIDWQVNQIVMLTFEVIFQCEWTGWFMCVKMEQGWLHFLRAWCEAALISWYTHLLCRIRIFRICVSSEHWLPWMALKTHYTTLSFGFHFLNMYSIEVLLIYNAVFISAIQQTDSVIHKSIYIFFFILFCIMVYHRILNIAPSAI